MGFDGTQKDFTYQHKGPATKVQFRVSHFENGKTTDLALSQLDVQPGDAVTLKPVWKSLASADAGKLHQISAGGVRRVRALKR